MSETSALLEDILDRAEKRLTERLTERLVRVTAEEVLHWANEAAINMWNEMFRVFEGFYWEAERGETDHRRAMIGARWELCKVLDDFKKERGIT